MYDFPPRGKIDLEPLFASKDVMGLLVYTLTQNYCENISLGVILPNLLQELRAECIIIRK